MSALASLVVTDVLWVLVFAGWVLIIIVGLEADKPLSGGIPGHLDAHELRAPGHWDKLDKLGELGGWVIFGVVSSFLPFVLYWIFAVHAR